MLYVAVRSLNLMGQTEAQRGCMPWARELSKQVTEWKLRLGQSFFRSSLVFCPSSIMLTLTCGFPGDSDGEESTVQETWVRPLGWDDPLENAMATHSSTLA